MTGSELVQKLFDIGVFAGKDAVEYVELYAKLYFTCALIALTFSAALASIVLTYLWLYGKKLEWRDESLPVFVFASFIFAVFLSASTYAAVSYFAVMLHPAGYLVKQLFCKF